jgi:hypothetical protein
VSKDAGIEPRTVATTALTVRRSNHSAKSHPISAKSHPLSAKSHPPSAKSHPHSAKSHPNTYLLSCHFWIPIRRKHPDAQECLCDAAAPGLEGLCSLQRHAATDPIFRRLTTQHSPSSESQKCPFKKIQISVSANKGPVTIEISILVSSE